MAKKELTEEEKQYKKLLDEKNSDLLKVHKGRLNGKDYFWLSVLFGLASNALAGFLGVLFIPVSLFFIYAEFCLSAKRFRDIGISGLFSIPFVVVLLILSLIGTYQPEEEGLALVAILFFLIPAVLMKIILAVWPAQKADNKYGPQETISILFGVIKKKKKD